LDKLRGDDWDHTAVDPEHRLLLSLVPGKRTAENCQRVIEEVKQRTGGRTDILLTSDEHPPYRIAIEKAYSVAVPQEKKPGPGRPPKPARVMPPELGYATVHKTRENGRVVKVTRCVIFGTMAVIGALLESIGAGGKINTSFVERNNGTERGQNSRKTRKTYRFSKDWYIHNAASYFTGFSYNFCWPVRTLRVQDSNGDWIARTPAMSAGLTDHVWSLAEWVLYPARAG
jgi:IS1 family transposase